MGLLTQAAKFVRERLNDENLVDRLAQAQAFAKGDHKSAFEFGREIRNRRKGGDTAAFGYPAPGWPYRMSYLQQPSAIPSIYDWNLAPQAPVTPGSGG